MRTSQLLYALLCPVLAFIRASQFPVGPEVQVFESFSVNAVEVVVDSVSADA
jgi:hypothetical protein